MIAMPVECLGQSPAWWTTLPNTQKKIFLCRPLPTGLQFVMALLSFPLLLLLYVVLFSGGKVQKKYFCVARCPRGCSLSWHVHSFPLLLLLYVVLFSGGKVQKKLLA